VFRREVAEVTVCETASMFPFARSRLVTTPSMTWFMLRMLASSRRREASWASRRASSVSWSGALCGSGLATSDGFDLWDFLGEREGEAKRSSVSMVSERLRVSRLGVVPFWAMAATKLSQCTSSGEIAGISSTGQLS